MRVERGLKHDPEEDHEEDHEPVFDSMCAVFAGGGSPTPLSSVVPLSVPSFPVQS